jgi:site-specific recombinase XerD
MQVPLLQEREMYLKMLSEKGYSTKTLREKAKDLFWIVQLLPLTQKDMDVNSQSLDTMVEIWSKLKINNSIRGQILSGRQRRFKNNAIDFLQTIGVKVVLAECSIPLLCQLYTRGSFLRYHSTAPLLEERIQYLQCWKDLGARNSTLRRIAEYLLTIMEYLSFSTLRKVTKEELNKAANQWACRNQGVKESKSAKRRFVSYTTKWLQSIDCLESKRVLLSPFQHLLDQYADYQINERGFSRKTVRHNFWTLKEFLKEMERDTPVLSDLTPEIIDKIFVRKSSQMAYAGETVKKYVLAVKSFLKYAEGIQACKGGLSDCIKSPRTYSLTFLPASPSWEIMKKIVNNSNTDYPTDIRDHAILQLLVVYGLRSSEVSGLCLKDIDWRNELLHVKRAKLSPPQVFPLVKSAGNALLRYIREIRPKGCTLEFVFLNMRAPYAPLSTCGIYRLVNKRIKPLGLNIKHQGPHCLRHGNATRLINNGLPIEEISSHLGHKNIDATRIYAKVDLSNLRKIAEMNWEEIL